MQIFKICLIYDIVAYLKFDVTMCSYLFKPIWYVAYIDINLV